MGWKNVKEHYHIEHIVQVTEQGICIGSPYIHDIIVIDSAGRVIKPERSTVNADLTRYQKEFEADPEKLRELVKAPDIFQSSITVYTYDGGQILEKQCEQLGWPNVTHDGQMMHDNTFSTNRAEVVEWAIKNARAGIKSFRRILMEKHREVAKFKTLLQQSRADKAALEAERQKETQ